VLGGITLLQRFTYEGDGSTAYFTPWLPYPAEFARALLVLTSHSRAENGQVDLQLQTSWDSSTPVNVGAVMFPGSSSTDLQSITTGLGPMVRLLLSGSAAAEVVISVSLVPKKS
jgi:hypothetical protein